MKRLPFICLFFVVLLLAFLITFSGCNMGSGSHIPGNTLPDVFRQSPDITLPADIAVKEISGDAVSPDSSCPATIVLENSSSASIDVTFDPGSNIWCTNEEAQNLILVYTYTLTVTAGSTETGTMPTYCLNSSLDAPDGDDSFVLGLCIRTDVSVRSSVF